MCHFKGEHIEDRLGDIDRRAGGVVITVENETFPTHRTKARGNGDIGPYQYLGTFHSLDSFIVWRRLCVIRLRGVIDAFKRPLRM